MQNPTASNGNNFNAAVVYGADARGFTGYAGFPRTVKQGEP
jgi:hypothetical protein